MDWRDHMFRIIISALVGIVIGVGATLTVVAFTDSPPASFECTVGDDGRVTRCTDAEGRVLEIPHDVRIR